jgi:hypothetical protein
MGPATAAALLFVSVTAAGATPSAPSSPDPAQAAAPGGGPSSASLGSRKPSAVFILVDDLGALHFPQKKCRQILAALWASWV